MENGPFMFWMYHSGNGDCPVRYVKLPEGILEVAFSNKVMKYEMKYEDEICLRLENEKKVLPLNLRVLDLILR